MRVTSDRVSAVVAGMMGGVVNSESVVCLVDFSSRKKKNKEK